MAPSVSLCLCYFGSIDVLGLRVGALRPAVDLPTVDLTRDSSLLQLDAQGRSVFVCVLHRAICAAWFGGLELAMQSNSARAATGASSSSSAAAASPSPALLPSSSRRAVMHVDMVRSKLKRTFWQSSRGARSSLCRFSLSFFSVLRIVSTLKWSVSDSRTSATTLPQWYSRAPSW